MPHLLFCMSSVVFREDVAKMRVQPVLFAAQQGLELG
jgi:hypothetical protein